MSVDGLITIGVLIVVAVGALNYWRASKAAVEAAANLDKSGQLVDTTRAMIRRGWLDVILGIVIPGAIVAVSIFAVDGVLVFTTHGAYWADKEFGLGFSYGTLINIAVGCAALFLWWQWSATRERPEENRISEEQSKAISSALGVTDQSHKEVTERPSTARERELYAETMAATEGATMEKFEAERQRLWRIHHGQLEGYDGDQRALAGKLAMYIEEVLRQDSPEYGKYLDKFAELSKPLEPFKKLFGGIPAEHIFDEKLPNVEGAEFARRMFASRDSFKNFREMLADDEQAFKFARDYTATELDELLKNTLSKLGRGFLRDYWDETITAKRASAAIDQWARQHPWIEDVPGLKEKVGKVRSEFSSIYTSRIGAAVVVGLAAAGVLAYRVLQP